MKLSVCVFGCYCQLALLAHAQSQPDAPAPPPTPATDPVLSEKLGSPQATWSTFREAANRKDGHAEALVCFDLSGFSPDIVHAKSPAWVFRLNGILDRTGLHPETDSEARFAIPAAPTLRDYVTAQTRLSPGELEDLQKIEMQRQADGLWRFSESTIHKLDELWERWQSKPMPGQYVPAANEPLVERVRRLFPPTFHQKRFVLLHDWQWISLVALLLLGFAADALVRFLLHYFSAAWFRFVRTAEEYDAERRLWKPVGLLAQALVWYGGMALIDLPTALLSMLLAGLKFFTVVAAIWTVFRLTDLVARHFCRHADKTDTRFDDLLVPLFSKTIKVIAIGVGVLMCAEALQLPITGLIGGLGLGGAALAFASKDTVSNLFGSFTVLIDRPFEIGDWIISSGVEGTVETVGFRSTRIRTFYNSLITVPNSLFTTAIVDNMGRRQFRRVRTTLQVDYDTTPEQIEAFCEGVRELIRLHRSTWKESYQVCLKEFGENSLDILLNCFLDVPDSSAEAEQRQSLFLAILRLADALDVSFAFPTRTLHMYSEEKTASEHRVVKFEDPHAVGRHEAKRICDAGGEN